MVRDYSDAGYLLAHGSGASGADVRRSLGLRDKRYGVAGYISTRAGQIRAYARPKRSREEDPRDLETRFSGWHTQRQQFIRGSSGMQFSAHEIPYSRDAKTERFPYEEIKQDQWNEGIPSGRS